MREFIFDLARFIPYRDRQVCKKVRAVKREDICKHPKAQFKIRVIENTDEFYFEFALDIVTRIRQALEKGKKMILILPAGPIPQYRIAARLINELGVSWQRFIARLVAYGPVNTLVPRSILQTVPTTYTLLGGVADNCEVEIR